ncbi:MAG: hypothetical protein ABFR19_03240 [Pseudomonadota bacterium]
MAQDIMATQDTRAKPNAGTKRGGHLQMLAIRMLARLPVALSLEALSAMLSARMSLTMGTTTLVRAQR